MTPETKRVKISCLISLFVGLVDLVVSWLIPLPFGTSIMVVFVPMVAGVLSLTMGIHGARAANVPQKAAGLRVFAAVIFVLTCAVFALALYMGHGLTVFAYLILPAVLLDLLIFVFAQQTKRALDRA